MHLYLTLRDLTRQKRYCSKDLEQLMAIPQKEVAVTCLIAKDSPWRYSRIKRTKEGQSNAHYRSGDMWVSVPWRRAPAVVLNWATMRADAVAQCNGSKDCMHAISSGNLHTIPKNPNHLLKRSHISLLANNLFIPLHYIAFTIASGTCCFGGFQKATGIKFLSNLVCCWIT